MIWQLYPFCVSHNFPKYMVCDRILISNILKMANSCIIFHSLESVLNIFNKNKDVEGVVELLNIYDKIKEEWNKYDCIEAKNKHPLIVLEGLDGSGKTTVGNRFAKKINALKWKTPPESICHIRHLFDNHAELRTPFYCLGNYIAALEVQCKLPTAPVVMDRYWHSTAAFAIAQSVQDNSSTNLPNSNDDIYSWPEDLFKPDIILLLDVSEKVRKERQSRRRNVTDQEHLLNNDITFRKNVIQAYKNMQNPSVTFVNGDPGFGSVLADLFAKTIHLLYK